MEYIDIVNSVVSHAVNKAVRKYPFIDATSFEPAMFNRCIDVQSNIDMNNDINSIYAYLYKVCENVSACEVKSVVATSAAELEFQESINVKYTEAKQLSEVSGISNVIETLHGILDILQIDDRSDLIGNVFVASQLINADHYAGITDEHRECITFLESALRSNGYQQVVRKNGNVVDNNPIKEVRRLLFERICLTPEDVVKRIGSTSNPNSLRTMAQSIIRALWCTEGIQDRAIDAFTSFKTIPSLEAFIHELRNRKIVFTFRHIRQLYINLTWDVDLKSLKELNNYNTRIGLNSRTANKRPVIKDSKSVSWLLDDCKQFADKQLQESDIVSYDLYIQSLESRNIMVFRDVMIDIYARCVKPANRSWTKRPIGVFFSNNYRQKSITYNQLDLLRGVIRGMKQVCDKIDDADDADILCDKLERLCDKYIMQGGNPMLLLADVLTTWGNA